MKYLKNYNTFILEKTYISCDRLGLIELSKSYIEDIVDGFSCTYNKLTSLKGAPKEVGGEFNCSHNNLTSLEFAPKKVVGPFQCHNNNLISLEGAPNEVEKGFYCSNNNLRNLDYLPEIINKRFFSCYNNNWSIPISYNIMIKYDLHPLNNNLHPLDNSNDDIFDTKWVYRQEQFDKFSSFEFQNNFLKTLPEKFIDLKPFGYADGIEELFPHLFDMNELGLLD